MIRADLKRLGWTQRQLAKELAMETSTLNRIIQNKEPLSLNRAMDVYSDIAHYTRASMTDYLIAYLEFEVEKWKKKQGER